MKTIFVVLAAVLVTLCSTSIALADTPTSASGDAPKVAVFKMPQFFYSQASEVSKHPEIIKYAVNTIVEEGDDARLSMSCTGSPTPVVDVFFGNTRLFEYPTFKYRLTSDEKGRYALMIFFAEPKDTGTYTFRVKNNLGIAETSAKLVVNVKYPPLLPEIFSNFK